MKKTIVLILTIIFSFSISVCAAEYEIKWFDLQEDEFISYAGNNSLVICSGMLKRLCDIDGNSLLDLKYYYITPFEEGIDMYKALTYETYFDGESDDDGFAEQMRQGGFRIYNDRDKYLELLKLFNDANIPVPEDGVLETVADDYYDTNGNLLYSYNIYGRNVDSVFDYEKISVARDYEGFMCVFDKTKMLTDIKYNKYIRFDTSPSYFVLSNDSEAVFGNHMTGEFIIVDSIFEYVNYHRSGMGVIAKKDDKYIYYTKELKAASELLFDEFIGQMSNSVRFRKDGIYYVFDNEGNLAYSGEKDIKAVLYGCYVMGEDGSLGLYDKNFNVVIPPKYNTITAYCDNVWIAETNDDIHIYNGSNLKLTGVSDISSNDFSVNKGYMLIRKNNDEKSYVYDTEGNEIASFEEYNLKTNGHDIFVREKENGKTGRVIFKNTEPNVLIDGVLLVSDTISRIKNDITLIPLRAFAEKAGFEVKYDENTKEIKITCDEKEIKFTIGKNTATADGKEITLEAPPEIINNRTLVPARAVSDVFGYDISWAGERRLVSILTK